MNIEPASKLSREQHALWPARAFPRGLLRLANMENLQKNLQMFAHYNCKAASCQMYMHVKTNDFEAEEDGREKIKVISVPFRSFQFFLLWAKRWLKGGVGGQFPGNLD